jgi:hypothetical protein
LHFGRDIALRCPVGAARQPCHFIYGLVVNPAGAAGLVVVVAGAGVGGFGLARLAERSTMIHALL